MKNFLLTGDRSGERKIKEIILATRLENTLTKDEILELYLNEIFLGQNSYGVTAAAQVYFGKSLDELTLAETAYLAALPQAPSVLHPVREKPRAIARRNYVLDQMAENGYVTREEAEAAKAEDLLTVQSGAIASARAEHAAARLFHRRDPPPAVGQARRRGAVHRRPDDPRHRRPDLQAVAAQALRDGLEHYDRGTARLPRPGGARSTRRASTPPTRRAGAGRSARDPGAARHRRLAPGGRPLDRRERGAHRHRGRRPRTPTATSSRFDDASWARVRGDERPAARRRGPGRHSGTSAT